MLFVSEQTLGAAVQVCVFQRKWKQCCYCQSFGKHTCAVGSPHAIYTHSCKLPLKTSKNITSSAGLHWHILTIIYECVEGTTIDDILDIIHMLLFDF